MEKLSDPLLDDESGSRIPRSFKYETHVVFQGNFRDIDQPSSGSFSEGPDSSQISVFASALGVPEERVGTFWSAVLYDDLVKESPFWLLRGTLRTLVEGEALDTSKAPPCAADIEAALREALPVLQDPRISVAVEPPRQPWCQGDITFNQTNRTLVRIADFRISDGIDGFVNDVQVVEVQSQSTYWVDGKDLRSDFVPTKYSNLIFGTIIIEYSSAVLFYELGKHNLGTSAIAGQAAFLAVHSYMQWRASQIPNNKMMREFRDYSKLPSGETLRIPRYLKSGLLNLPNGIHILSSAVAAGALWQGWRQSSQAVFKERWTFIPVVGPVIGTIGLPGILLLSVIGSCGAHFAAGFAAWRRGSCLGLLDAANMFAVSDLSRQRLVAVEPNTGKKGMMKTRWARWVLVIIVKVPLIWVKETSLAVEYDHLNIFGRVSLIVAILIGWYGIVPQVVEIYDTWIFWTTEHEPGGIRELWRRANGGEKGLIVFFFTLVGMIAGFMIILLVHFIGVFACPRHDLSVFKGCTGIMSGAANSSNASFGVS